MSGVTVRVPAKVNLQLSVGSRRDDGYHDLVNVFQAVSIFDEVTARPAVGIGVSLLDGPDGVPTGEDNLALRAARLLAEEAGVKPCAELVINKAIPVAGGMAGGSADAAGALLACNELWDGGLQPDDLGRLAARLGSDVPFALLGGTAVGLGRGERLTPVLSQGRFHWVFALAQGGLSTPRVYGEYDRLRARRGKEPALLTVSDELIAALRNGDAHALGPALSNDLQPAALSLRASLRRTLAAGTEHGALGSIVCGSGPTCAFLARSGRHAIDLAVRLSGSGVCRSVARAYGPVPGARVMRP